MKVLTGQTLPEPNVLTVGKFESFHLGHQALIHDVIHLARKKGIASAVVAFTPHPYSVLGRNDYKPLFIRQERIYLLKQLGVDYLLEYPFDSNLIFLPPPTFGEIVYEKLQAHTIVVGEGYRFGHKREGTVKTLQAMAKVFERNVKITREYKNISTSSIRDLLDGKNNGNLPQFAEAAALLGFPFFAMGAVTPGRKLGHTLGFPTLNIYPPPDKYLPRYGVYATQTVIDNRTYQGVTNVGLRPTVDAKETVPTIETHLFGFNEETYGQLIRVEFLRFLREEKKFPDLDALRIQIRQDIRNAGAVAIPFP
jgi:riboflavin kinase/FMN adenylyltransferase